MEALIIFIIMGILGSLFSKDKQKQSQKPMPPFNNKPNTTHYEQSPDHKVEPKRSRTLEDFAREVFEQLNEKTNNPQDVFTESQPKQDIQQRVDKTIPGKNELQAVQKHRESRPVLDENRSTKNTIKPPVIKDSIAQNEIGSYIPNSKQALLQAIIASEIIGPPKAKQR